MAVIGCPLLIVPVASATGTVVNATVCDQTAGTLQITSPAPKATVGKPDAVISGKVSRLSQIRAYINGAFHMTVPLDTASTSFTYTTNLAPGKNTIKLVGVDPCHPNGPVDSILLTFDPGAPVTAVSQAIEQTTATAAGTTEYMNGQIEQAAQSQPAAGFSGVLFGAMQSLDLAPVTGSPQSMEHMTQRFTAVTSGTVLLVLAQPILGIYYLVRYRFLKWNIHALPPVIHRHALIVLRIFGAGLFIVGLVQ